MGRELSINRIDFMKDGTAIVRKNDFYICGRTEFTGRISNLFYRPDKGVQFLVVTITETAMKDLDKVNTIHATMEDDSWGEREFDMEFAYINPDLVMDICRDCITADNRELKREADMLSDARVARRNTNCIKEFENFSDLIDELEEHYNNFSQEAKEYLSAYNTVEADCKYTSGDNKMDEVDHSAILLTYSE